MRRKTGPQTSAAGKPNKAGVGAHGAPLLTKGTVVEMVRAANSAAFSTENIRRVSMFMIWLHVTQGERRETWLLHQSGSPRA